MIRYIVYGLYNKGGDDPFYIGISKSRESRLDVHKSTFGNDITMEVIIDGIPDKKFAEINERIAIHFYLKRGVKLQNKQILIPYEGRRFYGYKIAPTMHKLCMDIAKKNGTNLQNVIEAFLKKSAIENRDIKNI